MTAPTAADLGPLFAAAASDDPGFLTNPATELERKFAEFHYAIEARNEKLSRELRCALTPLHLLRWSLRET
ncbi:MAG: hypothetical protein ACSLFK_13470 [Gemmatimonadaceae bacterium]